MIDFRPLSPTDAPRAAALIRAAFSAQGALTTPPSSALKESAGIVERKLLEGGGAGAFAGDELIGLILWAPDGDALYLGRLAVESETPRPRSWRSTVGAWRDRGASPRLRQDAASGASRAAAEPQVFRPARI